MRIDPAIAALQRDPSLQRQAQDSMIAACRNWRDRPPVAAMMAELERFGAGAALDQCPALHRTFHGDGPDDAILNDLLRRICAVLHDQPFAQPPFRHGFDGQVSTLLLARAGRAHLVLHGCEPGEWRHDSAHFSHAVRFERVLAGQAQARLVRRVIPGVGRPLDVEPITLSPGARLALPLDEQALQILQVERRLVCLRLHRLAADAGPSRCHALADGRLLHQSAGDMASSRCEMMLALLGRMQRVDAAPHMAAVAVGPGDASVRWQALRECLALDSGAGFAALSAMARDAADPLCDPAGALRAQLVEQHPQLLRLENADAARA